MQRHSRDVNIAYHLINLGHLQEAQTVKTGCHIAVRQLRKHVTKTYHTHTHTHTHTSQRTHAFTASYLVSCFRDEFG